jgi:hypothetical protein
MTAWDGVRDLVQQWAAAEQQNDAGLLDGLLVEDFAGVGPLGFVLTREQWLDRFASADRWLLANVHIGPLQVPAGPPRSPVRADENRIPAMSQPAMGLPGFPALGAVVGRMEAVLAQLREHRDSRRFFHATYMAVTRAVGAELAAGGFLDAAWVERWDVVFAGLYLDALESGLRGERVPGRAMSLPRWSRSSLRPGWKPISRNWRRFWP